MPYRYIEEIATADVAFEATGQTVEEVFICAAEATTRVMVEEPDRIDRSERVTVRLDNPDLDMLLYEFLSEIVYYKDARRLLLRVDRLRVWESDAGQSLLAELSGEKLDPARHPLGADVKAVTMHRFSVEKTENGWAASVVLDI